MLPYKRPADCLFSTYTLTSKMLPGEAFLLCSEGREALLLGRITIHDCSGVPQSMTPGTEQSSPASYQHRTNQITRRKPMNLHAHERDVLFFPLHRVQIYQLRPLEVLGEPAKQGAWKGVAAFGTPSLRREQTGAADAYKRHQCRLFICISL